MALSSKNKSRGRSHAAGWLCSVVAALALPAACSSDESDPGHAPGAGGGSADAGKDPPNAGPDASHDAGADGGTDAGARADADPDDVIDANADAGGDAQADAGGDAHADAGSDARADATDGGRSSLAELIEHGRATVGTEPRPAFGAILVATDGARSYVVESRRDVEPGPFEIPWRSRFRLAAYDQGARLWSYAADPDDVIGDAVVHPSGQLTLALLRYPPDSMAYELIRLGRDGAVVSRTTFPKPLTIPDSDYGSDDPRPLFRMKSDFQDATSAGWMRLLPDGEGLVAAFLSFVDAPPEDIRSLRLALGLMTLDWQSESYVERWTRVVDGVHAASPAAWAYDELRQREQAIRPFLTRDESTGDLLVGRAWNNLRCQGNVATFAEFTNTACVFGSVSPIENEYLPLGVTRFDKTGARRGTRVLPVEEDAAEQVPFGLAARDGKLATVGMVARKLPDGKRRTYPDANGYVDYDGYVIVWDADGRPLQRHDFNLGRGDVLAALRWTANGIVAAGSAGWDRWQGGQSISRGADPLFVWLSPAGSESVSRVIPLSDGTRHFTLHDVAVMDQSVVGYGFSDAPMTHSADGNNTAARTFGPLQIRLSPP